MARILLVDDDLGTIQGFGSILRSAGFDVDDSDSANSALSIIRGRVPDAVLSDLRLPEISGLDLLREVRRIYCELPFVIITGFGSQASHDEAKRLGATDYVEKPLIGDDVLRVVKTALAATSLQEDRLEAVATPTAHSASRWAAAIWPVLIARSDPRTLDDWSRCAGVSQSALKTWCRMARVSPKRSLNLARLLRAILRSRSHGYPLEESLDIVDERTLAGLLRAAGVTSGNAVDFPTDIDTFLKTQSLVPNQLALHNLRQRLKSHRL